MTGRIVSGLAAGALGLALVLAPKPAHAGLEACGNIDVKADAKCKVEVKGGCTAQCEPVRFEAACAAKFEAKCSGKCNASIQASCTSSCNGSCTGACNADPPKFECKGQCVADCEGSCSGSCQGKANGSECVASCKAACSGRCDASCKGTPGSASCSGKCEACCSGSCTAKANVDCNVNCQAETYASCKGELSGGCKVQCEKPDGALFCDGNYVDTGGNLANCINALNAVLKLRVDVSGSASCANGQCEAEGTASIGACSTGAPSSKPLGAAGAVLGLGALAFLARRRRDA